MEVTGERPSERNRGTRAAAGRARAMTNWKQRPHAHGASSAATPAAVRYFLAAPPLIEVNCTRTLPQEGSAVSITGHRRASVVMNIFKL